MKIKDLTPFEGKLHLEAKEKLFKLILEDKIILVDQDGVSHNSHSFDFEFISMESYVYEEMEDVAPFHYWGSCEWHCNKDQLEEDVFYDERFNEEEYKNNIFYENTYGNGVIAFKQHPCSLCKFKNNLNCIFIFDIGLGRKGMYSAAIEIVHTSYCTDKKIEFCKKNRIDLIEVNAKDIIKLKDEDATVQCYKY